MIPTIKFNDYLLNYLSENINKTADNEGLSKKVLWGNKYLKTQVLKFKHLNPALRTNFSFLIYSSNKVSCLISNLKLMN